MLCYLVIFLGEEFAQGSAECVLAEVVYSLLDRLVGEAKMTLFKSRSHLGGKVGTEGPVGGASREPPASVQLRAPTQPVWHSRLRQTTWERTPITHSVGGVSESPGYPQLVTQL